MVLESSVTSQKARNILQKGSKSLIRTLSSLIVNKETDASKSSLVLAGGLIQNGVYQQIFGDSLAAADTKFDDTQAVKHPALIDAEYLLSQI